MTRNVCFLLPATEDPWRLDNLRRGFEAVARRFESAGWVTTIAAPASSLAILASRDLAPRVERLVSAPKHAIPLLTGLGRESSSASLRGSYEVARALWDMDVDRIVAPLGGGIAHSLLMARAAGEAFQNCTVSIWWDDPAARRILRESARADDFDALVADAMERTVVRLADIVLGAPDLRPLPGGPNLRSPARRLGLPAAEGSTRTPGRQKIAELVFVGPAGLRGGLPDFLDAIEALQAKGRLEGRAITFLGPMRHSAAGLSKELLGVRAQGWDFRFSVAEVETPTAALAYLREPGRLAVLASGASDLDAVAADLISEGGPVVVRRDHPDARAVPASAVCSDGPAALEQALERALTGKVTYKPAVRRGDWVAASAAKSPLASGLARPWGGARQALSPSPPSDPTGRQGAVLTICITHRDRPQALREALDSIETSPRVEIIVVDNQSLSDEAVSLLDEISRRPGLRTLRLDAPIQQTAACNLAASEARTDHLVFLDDDNAFAPDGVEAFLRAMQRDCFDIVVSNLDVYDDRLDGAPAGRMIFLGDAGTAGLFFNGFGDTSMAVRRAAFLEVGGFDAGKASGPALDWVFLARARARGLRIGALQTPAVKYRRDLLDAERKWRKRDKEGALKAVLEAYEGAYEPELLARFAHGLAMGLL